MEPAAATPGEATGRAIVPLANNDLSTPPVFDGIDPRKLVLIKSQIAPNCKDGEVAHFLELCAHYDLDPFAREAWCAKSPKTGKLLIMVGRDGLRRIGQRNGLHIDGDVVRAKDEFTICRTPDGNRTVTHSYGSPAARGEIVGAWAECRMGGPMGKPMGYFYAPLSEYLPKNASDYSPWSKQVGVMILAAAERQAIRQATPLGGLLAIGEDEVVVDNEGAALDAGQGDGQPQGFPLGDDIESVLARAAKLGAARDRGMVEMDVCDRDGHVIPDRAAKWIRENTAVLDAIPQDAEVVDAQEEPVRAPEPEAPERTPEVVAAREAPPEPGEPVNPATGGVDDEDHSDDGLQDRRGDPAEALAVLRRRATELLNAAQAAEEAGNGEEADSHYAELAAVEANLDAMTNDDQGTLI